ncbi:hypothetical protein F4604DRAFT_1914646 [Suillus subluteus]|nr:hypothetical protein F4604DRAFT_1914646 [Suillus subluteus]
MNNLGRSTNDFDARLVIGPIQVGGLLSAALFGCLSYQSYVYFARFTNDPFILKAAVSAVIFIQLGHFVCIISILWTMTVSTYGDPSQLRVLPLAADLAIPLSAFTAFIVQSFFVFRLWRLTRNIFVPILCEIISVIAQTSTLILSSYASSMTDLTTFEDDQLLLIVLSLIARARDNHDDRPAHLLDNRDWSGHQFDGRYSSSAVLKDNFVLFGAWLMLPNVIGNSLLASLNRRLLLQETRIAQSRSNFLNAIVFRTGNIRSQTDQLADLKNRDVEVSQEAEHSMDQE